MSLFEFYIVQLLITWNSCTGLTSTCYETYIPLQALILLPLWLHIKKFLRSCLHRLFLLLQNSTSIPLHHSKFSVQPINRPAFTILKYAFDLSETPMLPSQFVQHVQLAGTGADAGPYSYAGALQPRPLTPSIQAAHARSGDANVTATGKATGNENGSRTTNKTLVQSSAAFVTAANGGALVSNPRIPPAVAPRTKMPKRTIFTLIPHLFWWYL